MKLKKKLLFVFFIVFWIFSCGDSKITNDTPSTSQDTNDNYETDSSEDDKGEGFSESPKGTEPPCQTGLSLTALFDCNNKKIPDIDTDSSDISWILPSSEAEEDKRFSGIGRFGTCTGSLIEPSTETDETSPAYILTNGHCISYQGGLLPAQGEFFDLESSKSMTFGYYYDLGSSKQRSYKTETVLYASMDGLDMALVKLKDVTLHELKSLGLESYKLSSQEPELGTAVENIGIPAQGVSPVVLRWSRCLLEKKISLKEDSFEFSSSYALKCNVLGGSSGSAVFNEKTKEIVGLINTTVNDSSEGQSECSLHRPCEVDTEGNISTNLEANYMQPVQKITGCFTAKGVFDKELSSCSLSDP